MSYSWNYQNIGASVTTKNRKFVESIFRYIGYSNELGECDDVCETYSLRAVYPDYEKKDNNVYGCKFDYSSCMDFDGPEGVFEEFKEKDLFDLLNALFPNTIVFSQIREGSNASWQYVSDNIDILFDAATRTLHVRNDVRDETGEMPQGHKYIKVRCDLNVPELEYVEALVEESSKDGNSELTALLLDLVQKIKDGKMIIEPVEDDREPDVQYDIDEYWEEVEEENWDEDDEDWDEDDEDEDE